MWLPLIFLAAFVGACQAQDQKLTFDGTAYTVNCDNKRLQLSRECLTACRTENYCAVRQVPYATAKRFERPQALSNEQRSEHQKNSTVHPNAGHMGCMQIDPFTGQVNGTEDCLTVDLYFRNDFFTSKSQDIFVIIEGLEMKSTFGSYLRPSQGFEEFDYILAVVHYRTGVLGFLSVEDELAPPNLGLFDQQMALEFLYNQSAELKVSGGKIVLLGFGSGAAAVSLHMANPVSRKYFNRALLSGGSALSPDATVLRPWLNAYYLAKQLDCKLDSINTITNCLKYEKNSTELVKAAAASSRKIRFAAFVDGGAQPKNTSNGGHTTQQQVFIGKPIDELILATDFAEGIESITYGYPSRAGLNHFKKAYRRQYTGDDIEYIKQFFEEYEAYEPSISAVVKAAHRQYITYEKSLSTLEAKQIHDRMIDMLTDFLVGGPMQSVIMSTLRNNKTKLISSYLLIPPTPQTASLTRLSLINHLYETKELVKTAEIDLYGASLDDLFFFIGCDALPYIKEESPKIEKSIIPMLNGLDIFFRCLRNPNQCTDTFTSNVKFPGDDVAVFEKQGSLDSGSQKRIDGSPKKVYRYDFNNFWSSIQPLVVGFENALDRERSLKREATATSDKLEKAGWKQWGLIAGIIVTSIIAFIMALVVVKLVIDRFHRQHEGPFQHGVKGRDRVDGGSTSVPSE